MQTKKHGVIILVAIALLGLSCAVGTQTPPGSVTKASGDYICPGDDEFGPRTMMGGFFGASLTGNNTNITNWVRYKANLASPGYTYPETSHQTSISDSTIPMQSLTFCSSKDTLYESLFKNRYSYNGAQVIQLSPWDLMYGASFEEVRDAIFFVITQSDWTNEAERGPLWLLGLGWQGTWLPPTPLPGGEKWESARIEWQKLYDFMATANGYAVTPNISFSTGWAPDWGCHQLLEDPNNPGILNPLYQQSPDSPALNQLGHQVYGGCMPFW